MLTEIDDERMSLLIPSNAQLQELGSGFGFTEGPVWISDGEYLLFSDVVGNARYRWDERDGVRRVAGPTGHGNGMTLDADGMLIVCEHDTSTVARMAPDGSGLDRTVIASHLDGLELNSPNDVVVRSDGQVYFSDPAFGRHTTRAGIPRDQELDFQGVVRVRPGADTQAVRTDFLTPNGLCFSPDEAMLYVNDTDRGHIRLLELDSTGACRSDRLFVEGIPSGPTGGVDGMKCDVEGNVWVTGPGGIWVFDPGGTRLGVLRLPNRTGNFHWGGPGWSVLHIACGSQVFQVQTGTRGRPEPFMAG